MTESTMTREEAYEALEAQLQALSAWRGGAKLGPVSREDVTRSFDHGMAALRVLSAPIPVGEVESAAELVSLIRSDVLTKVSGSDTAVGLVTARDAAITAAAERAGYERMREMANENLKSQGLRLSPTDALAMAYDELRSKLTQKDDG